MRGVRRVRKSSSGRKEEIEENLERTLGSETPSPSSVVMTDMRNRCRSGLGVDVDVDQSDPNLVMHFEITYQI